VWLGPDLERAPETWTHRFSVSEIEELDVALKNAREANLDIIALRPSNFPLPTLSKKVLLATRDELVHGRGMFLFKGLPVERWSQWEICAAFYGMGTYMGWTCPQNAKGHVLGHVKDLGADPNDPETRFYTTNAAQPFHTDSADIVGLLCIQNSKSGGESQVVSTAAVYNALREKSPVLAKTLTEPFPVDRKGEVPVGKEETYAMPVFHVHRGDAGEAGEADDAGDAGDAGDGPLLSGIYDRNFIDAAQRRFSLEEHGVPRLTRTQVEALDALDATCRREEFKLQMRLEPGDVQWLHNHTTFHARSRYENDEANVRHLLRLWITPENARPLPAIFAERLGNLTPGPGRGGIRVSGQVPYCATAAEE
jgi:hypothetical protein